MQYADPTNPKKTIAEIKRLIYTFE
jgi:hypothetical protein